MIPQSDRPLMINCDYRSGTGYATLTREIIRILHKNNVDFRLLPEPELFTRCTSPIEDDYFDSFIIRPHERGWLSDNDYNYFRLYPPRENSPKRFSIGFTMVEGYSVNPQHMKIIDDSFDLILVPSYFVKNVFSQYLDPLKVEVIPLGVDINVFNKENVVHETSDIYKSEIKKIKFLGNNNIEYAPCDSGYEIPNKFRFTMNGSFNHRKGVDLALRAYAKTFTQKDDVALILFCTPENPFEAHRMKDRILEIMSGFNTDTLPHCYVYDQAYPTYLQSLPYAHSDCFLFPSRGEGFGLPVLEAGACEVPVISPNHTGLSDFVNNSNVFVLDIDKIDNIGEIGKQYDVNTYVGNYPEWTRDMFHHQTKNCYFPIMNSDKVLNQMGEYMKYVYNHMNSYIIKEKVTNMKKMIDEKYTWNNSASYLMGIFIELRKR